MKEIFKYLTPAMLSIFIIAMIVLAVMVIWHPTELLFKLFLTAVVLTCVSFLLTTINE